MVRTMWRRKPLPRTSMTVASAPPASASAHAPGGTRRTDRSNRVRTVVRTPLPAAWNPAKSCSPTSIPPAWIMAPASSGSRTCQAYRRRKGLITGPCSRR